MLRHLAPRRRSPPSPIRLVLASVGGLAILVVGDVMVVTRRVEVIRALVRPGMTGPEVIRAVGPWSGAIDAPGCIAEPATECRHIRLATRGPLLASYVIDIWMGGRATVDRIERTGPRWAF